MDQETTTRIHEITGARPARNHPLGGGCIGDVRRVDLDDGRVVVAKLGGLGSGLACEGEMIRYLATHSDLPVPGVLFADDGLLLMDLLPTGGGLDTSAQEHAADLVAALHDVRGPAFGFQTDTVIGSLDQPNTQNASWLEFFRDQRLRYMALEAANAGRLPGPVMHRIDQLAAKLSTWIDEPTHPSLIHGDMWTGNVLCDGGRISGFIDPAIYYADPEIELAFTTLFGTFGDSFFNRYREHRPLAPGFFEERRDLYNLYPLLVHVRLFGGSYVSAVEKTLKQFGC